MTRPPAAPDIGRAGGQAPRRTATTTDWLRHDLAVSGPAPLLRAWAEQAAGPGAIPWQSPDLDLWEEDRAMALLRPPDGSPGLSLAGARALARQLRGEIERHEQRVGDSRSRACPLDLHRLCPVPEPVLRRGPADPTSQAWLAAHWGTGQSLRQVRQVGRPDRRRSRAATLDMSFWSADWTPWAAFAALRKAWPELAFNIRPDYGDAAGE